MAEHGHDSHGNTVAAWSCVGLLMVGSFIMCLAVVLASVPVFVVGGVVAVIGLVVGKLLSLAGYGAPRPAESRVPADAN
ncbi:HGxxPAAW family protein [Angustibacter sp. McL0619]|uniref:HGxxPAAW family protein n=1 Tax=Angustibacter sp. McL0619 TaxID=3415676 RepID=UPI003CEC51BC